MNMIWHDIKLRTRALLRLQRAEEELDEELQFHLEMEARKLVESGLSETEARRQARIHFGGVDVHKEECRTTRGTGFIEALMRDLRYAIRGFRRTPAFALTVIGTIGLALGLNTTLFTIFNAYVLRPIAVRDPHSLYELMWTTREGRRHSFTWQQFQEFSSTNQTFTSVTGVMGLMTRVDRRVLAGELVAGNYFQMLGVRAVIGRPLLPDDCCAAGSNPLVVLSHATWKDMFGGDTNIVGRKLLINGHPVEVIGVVQPEFAGLGETPRDFWVPLSMAPQLMGVDPFKDGSAGLRMIGRLKPELSTEQASAVLLSWVGGHTATRPEAERASEAILYPQATRVPLSWEMVAAVLPAVIAFGLVLVIACANVGNMMLSRMLSRQREIGIRLSLGAVRFRLIQQLLTECLILAVSAGAAGLLLSELTIRYGQALMLRTMPVELMEFVRIEPLNADLRVFCFMLAAAAMCTLLFGLAPALQVTRSSLVSATRGDFGQDHRPARLRSWLIVSQVTCCVLLLITAAVLLRASKRMQQVDTGVRTEGIVLLEVKDSSRQRVLDLLAVDRLVQSVATAASIPLNGSLLAVQMTPSPDGPAVRTAYNLVSPEYFPMLDVPILKGRNFTAEESRAAAQVVILSASTAERFFPGADPLGRLIQIGDKDTPRANRRLTPYSAVRVIGIARDVACESLYATKASPCVYLPAPSLSEGSTIFVKVNEDAESARQKLDLMLAHNAPGAVQQLFKFHAFLAATIYPFRAVSWVCTGIGSLALLLTLSGVYGVLSYLVTQRTREIGIRVALGATVASVIGIVMKQSMRYSLRGVVVGTLLALGISRLLSSHLTVVDPFDAVAYLSGILAVIVAALAAAYFPSRRAAQVDPASTLRCD